MNQRNSRWLPTLLLAVYFLGALPAYATTQQEPIKLMDYQVYPINGVNQFEPSGLTLKNGELYTVGDKHAGIYRIDLKQDEAWLSKVIHLDSERDLGVSVLDLEGITTVNGDFVVVSEVHHRLILVEEEGLRWLPEQGNDLYQSAFDAGLLQLHNAGLEGIAFLDGQTFLLAAERQPRGLIELTFNHDFSEIEHQLNQVLSNSQQGLHKRNPDVTGLFVHDKHIFGLHRNAYVIHEINKSVDGDYKNAQAWSYEHIVRAPAFVYSDMRYGHAEGLAVDNEHFYLVLDNNQVNFVKNPNDKRPLLIIAKRPRLYRGD